MDMTDDEYRELVGDLPGDRPQRGHVVAVADLPSTVGLQVLSALLGLSGNRVTALARQGAIPRGQYGAYPLLEAVRAYVEWQRENPIGRHVANPGHSDEKQRLTAAQADLAELKLAQTRGELLPLEDVRREWASLAVDLRARLMAISPRIAATLGLDRATAARLDKELRAALEDIANDQ